MRLPDGSLLVSIPKHYSPTNQIFEIYYLKEYELVQKLMPGMTVLDVGASIGIFTLKASRIVGPSGRVIAVEPDPESFDCLQKNLAANGVTNATAINVAAWNNFGSLELNVSVNPVSRFIVVPEAQVVEVSAMPLDNVLPSRGVYALDFVKMDVEGSAMEVLEGLSNYLMVTKHVAIAAYHKRENVTELSNFLKSKGFNVVVHGMFFKFVPFVYASKQV
jgi:FkbM family methyltransferase